MIVFRPFNALLDAKSLRVRYYYVDTNSYNCPFPQLPSTYFGEQLDDDRTTDEIIRDASAQTAYKPEIGENQVLTELDMVLDKDQYIGAYQG